jgi:hypothetical protein
MKVNNSTSPPNTKLSKQNKKISFSGKVDFMTNFLKLERKGNMTRNLFTLNAFIFLLGGRLFTSRDNDEKRETLTRDIPTILIAVFGVPLIKNFIGKKIQKKTGLPIMSTDKNFATKNQLNDWYKYNDNLALGFKGFTERLVGLKGNLKKIYSSLGKDIEQKLISFSENNDEFMKELAKNKKLEESIKQAFSNPKNKVLEHASFLKTVPTIIGFTLTLATIGMFIPRFNIYLTEKINKNKPENPQEEIN